MIIEAVIGVVVGGCVALLIERLCRGDELKEERSLREFWEERAEATAEAGSYLAALSDVAFSQDEIQYAMGRIGDDDETYRAIVKTIQKQFEVEEASALGPGANGVREYNAGRAAAVSDVMAMLEQMRQAGRRRSEEQGAKS